MEEVEFGVIFLPFNFTLSTELNPEPLIVTGLKTAPEVVDKPFDVLIRGNAETVGVCILCVVCLGDADGVGVVFGKRSVEGVPVTTLFTEIT